MRALLRLSKDNKGDARSFPGSRSERCRGEMMPTRDGLRPNGMKRPSHDTKQKGGPTGRPAPLEPLSIAAPMVVVVMMIVMMMMMVAAPYVVVMVVVVMVILRHLHAIARRCFLNRLRPSLGLDSSEDRAGIRDRAQQIAEGTRLESSASIGSSWWGGLCAPRGDDSRNRAEQKS
jgi:hypothetical protein